MTDSRDTIHRFLFARHDVRGELVQIDHSYQQLIQHHQYPPVVARLLGELMAVTSLLTATLKFAGHINVQLQGNGGPINFMTVNGSHQQQLRGVARVSEEQISATELPALFGSRASLIITLTPQDGERYQGVVGLTEASLAANIEQYFAQSEQLATRLWLTADEHAGTAAGLLLQSLPGEHQDSSDFSHLATLANTVTDQELTALPVTQLLHRLYHEEDVELYPPQPVAFYCGCSRERTAEALRTVPREELEQILAEDGELKLTCDYCLTEYRYDAVDVGALDGTPGPGRAQ